MNYRKYRNTPTTVDGIRFDSMKEANRYAELKLLQKEGLIAGLLVHPPFSIKVNGKYVCTYVGDFHYLDVKTGKEVLEDTKGVKTPVYQLKKKLMLAVHGITIVEV